jgi:type II secretory pathway component PulC
MEAENPMKLPLKGLNFPWKLLFWVAAALLCGIILAQALGLALDIRTLGTRLDQAKTANPQMLSMKGTGKPDQNLEAFSRRNLFGLEDEPAGSSPGASSLADVKLLGTLPPMAALFRVNGTSRAVLVGQKLGNETLKRVEGTRVFLVDGSRNRTLEVLYAGAGGGIPALVQPPPRSVRREPATRPDFRSGITSASDGQEGTIERETINKLLMDPYQELNRVRLRPKMGEDGSPQGIEAQWLHKDSLLLAMGLQSGDVIHSVNDIPIRTTSDIVNAMNSLLNSDRFVVAFFRDGADSQVAYSVK